MKPALIDTNLLLLLTVGRATRSYIGVHKRLKAFTAEDFDLLLGYISSHFTEIVVLPHILAEVSNLAAQIYPHAKRHIRLVLADFVREVEERQVPSSEAVSQRAFIGLGLTDAAILLASGQEGDRPTILTVDLDLAVEAEMAGLKVVNFNHLRAD